MTLVMKEVLLQGKIKYLPSTYFGAKCIFNYILFFLMLGIKEVQTLENPFKPIAQLEQ